VPHLTPAAWDDPVVQQLTCAQQIEMRDLYDGDIEPGVKPSASDIAVVLVARDDEAFGHYRGDDTDDSLSFARVLG
jgi:hypothetical protein